MHICIYVRTCTPTPLAMYIYTRVHSFDKRFTVYVQLNIERMSLGADLIHPRSSAVLT